MRSLAFVLVTPILACSPAGQPGDSTPDATALIVDGGSDGGSLTRPDHGFQIISPTVDINPGAEITYCYYFHTPNTSDVAVQRWVSHMTPGGHHLTMYLTQGDQQTPGTLSTTQCGLTSSGVGPIWTYSAQTPDAEAKLPANDGLGNAVGQPIPPGKSGFLQMHYLNATDQVIHAHVEINAYAYPDGVSITPAGPFVAFNRRIDLPPGSAAAPTSGMVSGNCQILLDNGKTPKFYLMTTHTHKQGTRSFVKDGAAMVFDTTNWEHPGTTAWNTPPFYTFSTGILSYQCEYSNPNNYRIQTGDSAATDEMCLAVGYYFPAADGRGQYCLNSANIPY